MVAFGAAATFSFGVEPVIAQQLTARFGLAEHQIGTLLSAEFFGSMIATVPAFFLCQRARWRRVALCAGLVLIVANIASALCTRYDELLLCRTTAGLASGMLVALTLTVAAATERPARTYGLWVLGQTVTASLGLLCLPRLPPRPALGTTYALIAALMLAVLPLSKGLERAVYRTTAGRSRWWRAAAILGALFLFYLIANGLWAFAARRADQLQLAAAEAAPLLSGAYLLSAAGAGVAAWIGATSRYGRLAATGMVVLASSIWLFGMDGGRIGYALFAILLQLSWAFTAPLLLSMAAEVEASSAMMAPATAALGAGLTAGPLLAGYLFEGGGVRAVVLVFAALLGAAAVLLAIQGVVADRGAS